MITLPEYRPPEKSQKAVIFLSALFGLVFVNFAVYSFVLEKAAAAGWMLLVLGLAGLTFALWRAIRIRGR